MASWQVQKAKSRLSQVLEDANRKGPQIITRHGEDWAAVVSMETLREIQHREQKKDTDFKDWLLNGPMLEPDDEFFEMMETIRDPHDFGREVDLELVRGEDDA